MTGQDWLEKDFYAALGVPKDADADAIKKAYRKLARKYHPDQNPGDATAEARFKEIGEAYAVLSDPEQRQQYDALRTMAGGGARFAAGGSGGGAGGFEDLFSTMFGAGRPGGPGGAGGPRVRYSAGGAGGFEDILSGMFGGGPAAGFGSRRGPQRGEDLHAEASLPFREAVTGATVQLTVDGRRLTARIPAGVRDGQRIRLRGKGRSGPGGGEPGDLLVTVRVQAHPLFSLDGRNLRMAVPVTFDEAALGATIEVPTLDGGTVRLKVPPGTPSGRTLRVRGKGAETPKGRGDLLVTVEVAVPERLSRAAKKAVQDFAEATDGEDPRSGLAALAAQ